MNPARPVLWVDPGGMTGIALWLPGRLAKLYGQPQFFCDEAGFAEAASWIRWVCSVHEGLLDAGWEHFSIGPKTHQKADGASQAIEMIGVCRYLMSQYHCRNVGPAMPEQRSKATPAMLKAIGWWVPGKDDAQSAAQHMLAWMMRSGCVPDTAATTLAALRSR